jgi:hypothetical protein
MKTYVQLNSLCKSFGVAQKCAIIFCEFHEREKDVEAVSLVETLYEICLMLPFVYNISRFGILKGLVSAEVFLLKEIYNIVVQIKTFLVYFKCIH